MRSYLKTIVAKLKAQKQDYFNYYQNNLCFYLDCLPIVIGITWWKVLIGFCDALQQV
jgi:hypothetical protein